MYSRMINPPANKSFFLFGPRGTGKTTWVKNKFPEAIYLDLLDSRLFNKLFADPGRLTEYIPPDYKGYVIIDEVQRVPELLNEVHRLIESQSNFYFILTGSNARKLRSKGHNLLAGRALTYYFNPLTSLELGKDFNLTEALKFGLLPSLNQEPDKEKYLSSYIQTYLKEEIYQEGLTRNLGNFARFLEVASFSQGSMINMSSVARDASINRKVVEDYFTILEDLLISHRLQPFTKRAKRRLVSHPKFYFFDAGIYRSIRPKGLYDLSSEIGGIALETLFFQNLKAINQGLELNNEIFFYRTASGFEVDFIVYGEDKLLAFEIKHSNKVTRSMLTNLNHFKKDYPMADCYLVYMGKEELYINGVKIVPAEKIFRDLDKILNPS